jgi:hypothetical protein
MSLDVVVTDDPPPGAFQVLWTPLLRFNEQKAGNTKSRTLAILLSEPATGKVVGGLWGRSLWGLSTSTSYLSRNICGGLE